MTRSFHCGQQVSSSYSNRALEIQRKKEKRKHYHLQKPQPLKPHTLILAFSTNSRGAFPNSNPAPIQGIQPLMHGGSRKFFHLMRIKRATQPRIIITVGEINSMFCVLVLHLPKSEKGKVRCSDFLLPSSKGYSLDLPTCRGQLPQLVRLLTVVSFLRPTF